jgi:hypothetical protein
MLSTYIPLRIPLGQRKTWNPKQAVNSTGIKVRNINNAVKRSLAGLSQLSLCALSILQLSSNSIYLRELWPKQLEEKFPSHSSVQTFSTFLHARGEHICQDMVAQSVSLHSNVTSSKQWQSPFEYAPSRRAWPFRQSSLS